VIKKDFRFREIPYNYTSFSDKEIILKYFDAETWDIVNELRSQRITGRSAKLLYEVIGDIFVIERNPYLFDDFLKNKKKLAQLKAIHQKRIETVSAAGKNNSIVEKIIERVKIVNDSFFKNFAITHSLRQRISFSLTGNTLHKNVQFTPFHRILHATDATDWRVEYPFVVVYPDSISEIPKLIKSAKKLGLSIIPRGGGTGLTGGAVPVNKKTMVINMEKLSRIGNIEVIKENGKEIPVISVESGVVTDDVIDYCERNGYIFATDPTSAWASTIGGNIAENAGGKKCVMWGTAIDNLYSFTIVNANGDILKIKRKNHPHRKILPEDTVEFDVFKKDVKRERFIKAINLSGTDIRKAGLGKDITNKALNGLPGIQKEGGDGIIVSAQFVLYRPFKFCKTLCLEFFGTNMIDASRAIVAIDSEFKNDKDAYLTALEHFDEKYVAAINYKNKSKRNEIPKAVLLIDIESEDESRLNEACKKTLEMISKYNVEGILARDEQERKVFWNDRKHLGAIAKHTNAFKLNEDIVIPLEKLPEFADFIELMNFKKEFNNSLATVELVNNFLERLVKDGGEEFPKERTELFIKKLEELKESYKQCIRELESFKITDSPINERTKPVFRKLQDNDLKFSFEEDVVKQFRQVFHGYENILNEFKAIVKAERSRKIIIATHMHAGDGNVHVNIPVHSSDHLMMQEADECAAQAMNEAMRLGGVVSGEHGIGLTKLKFVDKSILDQYQQYKKLNDPDDLFNPGKLDSEFPLYQVYTPSFNLLEREAIILESTDLAQLSLGIASCVRCGKCKSVCNTHYPSGNMLYNPRNKILAVGMVTEAVLFSAQTLDMKSFNNFKNLREISDYCTVCHKCEVPCPVKIDFGNFSVTMRNQLVHRKKTSSKLFTTVALLYLGRKKYYINKFFRFTILKIGYNFQRIGAIINKPIAKYSHLIIPKINQFLKTPFPKSNSRPLRDILKLKNPNMVYCFENPDMPVSKSVVYFPGCGSERMFPEISIAAIALLYNSGVRVVIPPEYLCCGYPFLANGKQEQTDMKSYENRVIFHRIADTAGYLNFDAVIVSCGTCYEMLEKYEIENIFNNVTLMDINEFLVREQLFSHKNSADGNLLYHEPCHTPLKHFGYERTFKELFGNKPVSIPNCCGEAGTLALSRPDISNILRVRKENNLNDIKINSQVEVLTTCPSCVMGLSKLNNNHKVSGKSLVVYNAEQFLGKDWQKKFLRTIKKKGVEKILF
jgi:FAD/FMN-containing dehydrogenase/Fe-S oxidoreductase